MKLIIIKKAYKLSDKSVSYAAELLKEGISEIEFAAELEAYMRRLGHQGIVRMRLWGNEMVLRAYFGCPIKP